MRKQVPWLAPCAALALSACATVPKPPVVNPPLDTSKACAKWRWIGITTRSASECPAIPGWSVKPLFPSRESLEREGAYDPNRHGEAHASHKPSTAEVFEELKRFCVFETEDGRGEAGNRPVSPAANRELVRFDQDCAALSIAADPPLAATVWRPAADRFLAQVGKPEAALQIENQKGVRLAFLDTQPTGIGVPSAPGYSLHGYTLAHIARHLVCSPETSTRCAAEITTRLALPLASFDAESRSRTGVDRTRGGHVGMQSDLAEAISSEVNAWLRDLSGERAGQKLVLNLSLAWDPRLFGGLDEEQIAELRAGTQAVYRALQYAASFDALVLAAAGNEKDCPDVPTDGPLLPAGWEDAGPREDECGGEESAPFVYAVGGLKADGDPLWNARPRGMPRRAAYADHAVVPTWDDDLPTAMYTGSSVATAVASSIAAVVWDTVPGLSAPEVMRLLDNDTGVVPSSRRADFWFRRGATAPAAPPEVHRLSLCEALEQACTRPGSRCPLRSTCRKWPLDVAALAGIPSTTVARGTCQPWLYPQPEDPPCPTCIKEPPR